MFTLNAVIANCGDGSNVLEFSTDPRVKQIKNQLTEEGDERYASGDGFQCYNFKFHDQSALQQFIALNCPYLHTMENRGDEWDYAS